MYQGINPGCSGKPPSGESFVKVLLVGHGAIADRHINAFRQGGAEVVAVAGRDLERVRAFASARDIPHAFADHRSALESVAVDIVSVATPPAAHAAITIDSLDAGAHVLCEKPFAMTPAEARAMVQAAERAGRLLGCWSSRQQFMWGLQESLRLAAEGALGDVLHVHIDFQWRDLVPGLSFQPESPWFLDSSYNGGGVLADWGSYWIDMALAFLPSARATHVVGTTFLGMDGRQPPEGYVRDAEELATAMVTFDTGASLVVQLTSRVHQPTRHAMRVWGTRGGVSFNPFDTKAGAVVEFSHGEGADQVTTPLVAPSELSMHDGPGIDFVDAVRTGRPPAAPGDRALQVVEITDAIYRSARTGRPVAIG
jgi:predicted dehydrogenase